MPEDLGITIAQLVANELPTGFVVGDLTTSIKVQQLLLYQQAKISEDDKYTESKWPDQWNLLIAYLIVFEIFRKAIAGALIINTGTNMAGEVGEGVIKKLVTGPAETEWQDTAAAFSTLVKNLTTDPNGIMGILMSKACTLSRVVGIKIPFCQGYQISAMFLKAGETYCGNEFIQYLYALNKPASMG